LIAAYKRHFQGATQKIHMATQKETVEFIVNKLGSPKRFEMRPMFGEYALYADGKVVGLVCDNLLYVKILDASAALEELCEKGNPYPGAKEHYVVEEVQLSNLPELPSILFAVSESIVKKPDSRKSRRRTGR
jgi:TfoX/Sxy family transcriptional regulator of competence genes